jgi:hypothetical protein
VRPASRSLATTRRRTTTTRALASGLAIWLLATALAPAAGAARPRALIVTTDFETGVLSTLTTSAPRRKRQLRTDVFSDAVVRVTGGHTIVLNRFLADNVQILGRKLRTRLQCPTGPGSNPHDVVVAGTKGYVTRYGGRELWVIDPSARGCGGFRIGTVDLAAHGDADGLPEMDQMAVVGARLFVTIQRLDRGRGFVPTEFSSVVVIDTTTDTVVGEPIRLFGRNAFGDASGIAVEPGGRRLAISTPGDIFAVGDGGIQWVDPDTLAPPTAFFATEDQLGGNVTDFVLVSATRAYAIVQGPDLRNHLVAFDPSSSAPGRKLFSRQGFLPDIALAPDGRLWLADQTRPTYGIRILDPSTETFLKKRPIDVGLPPFSIGFLP